MVDEHFDRLYQESRGELNAALVELGRRFADTFKVLNRIQYTVPWTPKHSRPRTY